MDLRCRGRLNGHLDLDDPQIEVDADNGAQSQPGSLSIQRVQSQLGDDSKVAVVIELGAK